MTADCRLVDERRLRGVLERVVVGKSVVNGGAVLVANTWVAPAGEDLGALLDERVAVRVLGELAECASPVGGPTARAVRGFAAGGGEPELATVRATDEPDGVVSGHRASVREVAC